MKNAAGKTLLKLPHRDPTMLPLRRPRPIEGNLKKGEFKENVDGTVEGQNSPMFVPIARSNGVFLISNFC